MRKRLALACIIALASACAAVTHSGDAQTSGDRIAAFYPEGPLWQGDKLYYAEMGADRISVVEHHERRDFFVQRGCGPTAIAPYDNGFLVLCHLGEYVVAVDAQGQAKRRWARDDAGHALRDPNDCYADGRGGVYFSDPGDFSKHSVPQGYVMHLSAEGRLTRASGELWYPNGVYVDAAHNVVYVDEHMAGRVLRYEMAPDAMLTNQSTFVDWAGMHIPSRYDTPYEETGPDGLEMAADGALWVAIYGEGRILRFTPDGQLDGSINLPTRYSTNIAFNAAGDAVTTGSFDNINAPFPGEVRFHPASRLTARAE